MKTQSLKICTLTLLLAQSAWADLLNVDFGVHLRGGGQTQMKVGFAATGITASDYWNFYSADNPDGSYKVNGFLPNLKFASGLTSGVGISVYNGDGAWSYPSSDPMLAGYIYSLAPDGAIQTRVSVTNLPAGNYNLYLYGPDSQFNLTVGGADYGTKVSYDTLVNPPPWVQGQQYVEFANVQVGASQEVLISLGPGMGYYQGTIGGMQIELVPEPACTVLLGLAGVVLALRARKHRALSDLPQ